MFRELLDGNSFAGGDDIADALQPAFRPHELGCEKRQGITSEFKEGVLTVHLPKKPEAKPKAVQVKVE
jgi:hypothetical protein